MGWDLCEILPTRLAKLPHTVSSNEPTVVAEGKAFVQVKVVRIVQKTSCNPEVFRTHFCGPIWLVALF